MYTDPWQRQPAGEIKKKPGFIMKNKTIFTGILILTLSGMLFGCGKRGDIKPADAAAKTEDTAQVPENTAEADASKEEDQDISDDGEINSEETDETGSEEPEDDIETNAEPAEVPYGNILYMYKSIQDGDLDYSEAEMLGFQTALIEYGWPSEYTNNEERYQYLDVTGDGKEELLITNAYGDVIDIYSHEEDPVYAYGVPYRGVATVYPDGTLVEAISYGVNGAGYMWFKYDDDTGEYVGLRTKEESADKENITLEEGEHIADIEVPAAWKEKLDAAFHAISLPDNMTDEELADVEKELNSIGYYGFLLSTYPDPSRIDWNEVFYVGAGFTQNYPSEEILDAYMKATGEEEFYTDFTVMKGEDVRNYVKKTSGMDYSEMKCPLEWTYLEDYDLYLMEHGDTNQTTVSVTGGHYENGEYAISYYGYWDKEYCVTFRDEGGDYLFISNLPK